MEINIIIANIFGFLACITNILMYQSKTKIKMFTYQIIYSVFMLFQFLFLKAYSAFLVSTVALIRGIIFFKYSKKDKEVPKKIIVLLIITIILIEPFVYKDLFSLIPLFIGCIYTLSLQIKNIKTIKKICILLSCLWIIYDIHVSAYMGIISASLDILSIIVYFIKNKRH